MAPKKKSESKRKIRHSKMGDLLTYVRAGTPVSFAYDRDMRYFIYSLLTEASFVDGRNLDDFEIFIYYQGFMLIRVKHGDKKNSLQFEAVEYKSAMSDRAVCNDPVIALNLFLGKQKEEITESRKALLIMAVPNNVIDSSIPLSSTLREHYNTLISGMQEKVIHREKAGRGKKSAPDHQADVPDYEPETIAKDKLRPVVILGNSTVVPSSLTGFVVNLGSVNRKLIPNKEVAPRYLTNNLTCSEQRIIETLMLAGRKSKLEDEDTISVIKRFRKGVFSSNSIIDDLDSTEVLENIGGYPILKEFIVQRKRLLEKPAEIKAHNIVLKGLMLAGVPGSGKSMFLKAIGNYWNLPSYRLMLEAAFGKYVGESEGNLMAALDALEKLAPCYVMIDEIDKSLAGVGENEVAGSDVPRRVFGILLDYMSRPNGIIFGVSLNRVESIPVEFTRKGRFDRLFFMDLPNAMTRAEILKIHLERRGYDVNSIKSAKLKEIISATGDFTGAEIEAVINEAAIRSIDEGIELTGDLLLEEVHDTTLIDKNKKDIVNLRKWAVNYAINAEEKK